MPVTSISVVIPAYNAARYLGEALDSVASQTRRPDEILVVDDGSDDATAGIARARTGVRCEVIEHGGPAAARNAGVACSRGEWVAFLDADDRWPPESLAGHVEALAGHPDADASVGACRHFYSPDADAATRARLVCPPGLVTVATAGAVLVRRALFDRVGGFDTTLALGEFIDWWMRVRQAGVRILERDALAVERRVHGASTTVRQRAAYAAYLQVARNQLARGRER